MEEYLSRLANTFDPSTIQSISGPLSLSGGLILGLLFGVVLQKGRFCKYDVVSGLFRLQDFTMFRAGAPIIVVSMLGIFLLKDMGLIELHIPKAVVVPQIVGGLLFGAGIAIMGYCPGTAAGALGEGSLDAIPSILGLIAGATLYAEFFHDDWSKSFLKLGELGRSNVADMLDISPWYVIVLFVLMAVMFVIMMTMIDWALIFLRRTFNMFVDVTDTIEEKRAASYKNQLPVETKQDLLTKFKKNLSDLFS
jgi:hypothetical protein